MLPIMFHVKSLIALSQIKPELKFLLLYMLEWHFCSFQYLNFQLKDNYHPLYNLFLRKIYTHSFNFSTLYKLCHIKWYSTYYKDPKRTSFVHFCSVFYWFKILLIMCRVSLSSHYVETFLHKIKMIFILMYGICYDRFFF